MLSLFKNKLKWLWLAIFIILADQLTKYLCLQKLYLHELKNITSWFSFTLTYNKGAAFSFLSQAGGWQRWFFITITIIVIFMLLSWIRNSSNNSIIKPCGAALVLGGAIGNLTDRILHGYVVDFILVHYKSWYFPAFNLADTAISIGVFLLAIKSLAKEK